MKNILLKDFLKAVSFSALLLSATIPSESQAFTGSGKGGLEVIVEEPSSYNVIGVALFSGDDSSFVSRSIKKATHSDLSHVGIILADAENENKWYCFESTGKEGAHISSWNNRVDTYQGDIRYRLFVFDDDRINSEYVNNSVKAFNGNSYPKTFLPLIGAWLGINPSSDDNSKPMFCSELAAEFLGRLNLILGKKAASNYTPANFDTEGFVQCVDGVELTPAFPAK